MRYIIENCHISTISQGDTILHDGILCTVSESDIHRSEFMGISIFGNCYLLGNKPVKKVKFE